MSPTNFRDIRSKVTNKHIYGCELKRNRSNIKQPQKNGEEKPIAYFSKKLNDSQKKKKAIYLECLAIKEAVKYWQHRLIGQEFTVFFGPQTVRKYERKM